MSAIWLRPEHTRIRSFGATVKGTKSIVRIELEVDEPGTLGFLLEDLGSLQCALAKPAKKPGSPPPPLAIPDLRGKP